MSALQVQGQIRMELSSTPDKPSTGLQRALSHIPCTQLCFTVSHTNIQIKKETLKKKTQLFASQILTC